MKIKTSLVGLCALMALADSVLAVPGGAKFQNLNTAFGVPLWQSELLWAENERDVGKRLAWPEESRTTTLGSYRLYPKKEMTVLGAHPQSLALYAEKGKVTQVSMVFANRGDRATKNDMESDARTIEAALKPVLGEPTQAFFGQTRKIRYKVKRWNWKNHAILLEMPPETYIGVRIMPLEVADREGRADIVSYQQLRDTLSQRVQRRPSGDVVVGEIPMVDQGPKGYCVPATWERYLRYLGIQADMYVLALAGQTKIGGGTLANLMFESVEALARRNGRRFEQLTMPMTAPSLAKYIDKGFPLMWCIFVDPELEKQITKRAKERAKATDWNAWMEQLKPARNVSRIGPKHIKSSADTPDMEINNAHMRMIIGYNPRTKEVAISDSWGKHAEERWITLEEAQAMTQGDSAFWNVRW
ncbi:MAG: hypothetical protein NTY01_19835 [Verrucomicrobia bacterium]|nr:hypothetical protein [Verrucomicrobiota bacterium]